MTLSYNISGRLMQKTEIINVRLPEEIVDKIDFIVKEKLYSNRSEVIRQFLREFVSENKNQEDN